VAQVVENFVANTKPLVQTAVLTKNKKKKERRKEI
jgi:hypothetical protein